jgi:hypothetical protein
MTRQTPIAALPFAFGRLHMKNSANKKRSLFRLVAENPLLNITVGFILMATSLLECLEPLFGSEFQFPFGAHHGAALFGLVQFMKCLPDLVKGLQFIEHGEDESTAPAVARD